GLGEAVRLGGGGPYPVTLAEREEPRGRRRPLEQPASAQPLRRPAALTSSIPCPHATPPCLPRLALAGASRAGQGRAPVSGPPHALVKCIALSATPPQTVLSMRGHLAHTTTAWIAQCSTRHVLCGFPVLQTGAGGESVRLPCQAREKVPLG